jgi:uncharacterized protein (DUF362 family)
VSKFSIPLEKKLKPRTFVIAFTGDFVLLVNAGIGKKMENPYQKDGKVLVSKVGITGNLKTDILRSVDMIGGFERVVKNGDQVLLKPNYNSSDNPPASSDPKFVRVLTELLLEHGAEKVIVGESSMQTRSTRRVMEKTGTLEDLKNTGVETVFFDEGKWVGVNVGGEYLKRVSLAERALRTDKLVYCCCMKTHFRADFSLSLKLAFGFTKGSERMAFHLRHLKEKIVDLNLVVHPSLMVMDGRKCFITGGPFSGHVKEPNVILASGDRVALDVEAIKIIEGFEGAALKDDPWSYPQIRHALRLGLGVRNEYGYEVANQ